MRRTLFIPTVRDGPLPVIPRSAWRAIRGSGRMIATPTDTVHVDGRAARLWSVGSSPLAVPFTTSLHTKFPSTSSAHRSFTRTRLRFLRWFHRPAARTLCTTDRTARSSNGGLREPCRVGAASTPALRPLPRGRVARGCSSRSGRGREKPRGVPACGAEREDRGRRRPARAN